MATRDLWTQVLDRLQPTIKKANFITWFQGTGIKDINEGKALIAAPTVFACDWLSNKYGMKIEQALKEVDGNINSVEYIVDASADVVDVKKDYGKKDAKVVRKVRKQNEVVVKKGGMDVGCSQILSGRYSLDSFISGLENRLPHAAATAVGKNPGGIYNPLYIYGSVGLGKTHLLQAIGNEVLRGFPEMVVKYITAERFVSEVINAIAKRKMNQFKQQYRNVDCLLIDDVQFFARKNSSQQEFFHTFNELYDLNKQIVLTSDRPPTELEELDDRLTSRFGMGMVVELLFPEYETRLAILQQKCQEMQMIIAPEVLEFIATNVHNNVRELEGVLKQAVAFSQLNNQVPTIHSVAEIIRRLNKAQKIIGYDIEAKRAHARAQSATDVKGIVANYFKISTNELEGKGRKKEVMLPRQVCMYLIKNELGQSYESIGGEFGGRNHTTVMHACSKTAERLKTDLNLVKAINAIKNQMGM